MADSNRPSPSVEFDATFLNRDDLCAILRLTKVQLQRRRKAGVVPEPDMWAGKRTPLWRRDHIMHWLGVTDKEGL